LSTFADFVVLHGGGSYLVEGSAQCLKDRCLHCRRQASLILAKSWISRSQLLCAQGDRARINTRDGRNAGIVRLVPVHSLLNQENGVLCIGPY